jgi:hypothetical protein
VGLAVGACLFLKHDIELDRELVLELDLEIMDQVRPRAVVASPTSPCWCGAGTKSSSEVTGERRASLICCRPSVVRSGHVGDIAAGDSTLGAALVEFLLVLGFDSLFEFAVLGWLPILWGSARFGERQRSKLLRRTHQIVY